MDAIRVERTCRHDLLDLGDAHFPARRRGQIEVARRLAKHEVAGLVGFPPLDDAEVGANAALQHERLSVELLVLFAFGNLRPDTRLRIKARNTRAPRAHALGEGALRGEFDLDFAGEEL